MKILVVDIAASTGGALSILRDFYNEVLKDKKNEYIFLLSGSYIEEKDNVKTILMPKEKKWLNRLIFDYFKGKKIVNEINPDMILSFQNTVIRGTNKKNILYVHQPLPFQEEKNFSLFKKSEFKFAIIQYFIGFQIKKSIKLADKVIVQTEWMKNAIIKKCKITEDKIQKVVPMIENISITNCQLDNKLFFYPASNIIYKNHDLIYKAVKILNEKNITDFSIDLTIDGNDTKNIKYISTIPRNEVYKKYQSRVLIFPSYIETYGLPLAEARKAKTIILAADTLFSREILKNYENAYFFSPFNAEELAELMLKVIKSKIKRKKITVTSSDCMENYSILECIGVTK